MAFKFFPLLSKSYLGIDIGTSALRVVEITEQKGKKLKNYGELGAEYFSERSFRKGEREVFSLADKNITAALLSILKEAKIKEKRVFFSIPDFATFFTTFELPAMSKDEIPEAVRYEAPRRIPLPLSEVTLDWEIIKEAPASEGVAPLKILLVAVPNEIITQYQNIAVNLGLKLLALEAEVFALSRALIKYQDKSSTVCLIDIGARSTTVNIVDLGILKVSHSFDIAGNNFTKTLSEELEIDFQRAEIIKKMYGITAGQPIIQEILLPQITPIFNEAKNIFNNFYLEEKKAVQKIILSGGSSLMPGLLDYLTEFFNLPIEIANPFLEISFPPTLSEILKKIGPRFTIAVGVAQRGFK
jgi:type IV pilus assembly protein PilM